MAEAKRLLITGASSGIGRHAARRLEQEGYILGYRAVIDPTRLGLPHVAFVEVRLSDTRKAALDAFNKAVRALPEVEQAHMIASSFDYLLKVRTKDIAAYREVLGEKISALPHVAHTSTHVSMEAVKDDAEQSCLVRRARLCHSGRAKGAGAA